MTPWEFAFYFYILVLMLSKGRETITVVIAAVSELQKFIDNEDAEDPILF